MHAFVPPLIHSRPSPFSFSHTPRRPSLHACFHCCAASSLISPTYPAALRDRTRDIDTTFTDTLIQRLTDTPNSSLSQQTLEDMVIHLADTRGMARLALVEAFGRIGPTAVPTLLKGLSDCPNPVVRRSCGKALAKIGDPRAIDGLLYALVHDDDTVTRSSAAGALARMGSVAVPRLLALISNPIVSMTAKGHAAWAISFMQGDAGAALFESLQHPNRDVRIAVVSALGAVAIGDALPAMGGASDDDWGEGDGKREMRERAVVAMRTALGDENAEVRAEAATALANAGCVEEVGRIADMLSDADAELRRCAALALLKLGDPCVVAQLRERERDENEVQSVRSVARLAANTLERVAEQKMERE